MKKGLGILSRLKLLPEWAIVSVAYLVTHLPSLTLLPVFADEAIYIRWAQLIIDDPGRYAFFSMADGKPPLFMWLLSIVLRMFPDPLYAGRFLSVLIGLLSVFVLRKLVSEFKDEPISRWTITVLGIFTPFWFFYHRMALMDGLLSLMLSLAFLFAIKLSKEKLRKTTRNHLYVLGLALSYGAALATKTPALFAIPIIAITPVYFWWRDKHSLGSLLKAVAWVGVGGFLGVMLFATLKYSPLFGSLFARSTDFTFTFSDLISGEWRYVLGNSLRRNLGWIIFYLTPGVVFISLIGLFQRAIRKDVAFLLISALLFFAPLTLFGRVLWPRYFLPVTPFILLAASLSFSVGLKQRFLKVICLILLIIFIFLSGCTVLASIFRPEKVPLVVEDGSQYLYEWSAGYGNTEVRDFIKSRQLAIKNSQGKRIIVLTEGSFGTLPDGLLMYFHNHGNALNMEVHGIGVGVPRIPREYVEAANEHEVYYVLNSHRYGIIDSSKLKLRLEVSRPLSPGGIESPKLMMYQVLP